MTSRPLTPYARVTKWIADGRLIEAPSDCWLWTGALNDGGYGQMAFRINGHTEHHLVHRWLFELHVITVPDGLDLDHLCRVRRCANPWHLEPVTRSENLRRGVGIGSQWSSRDRCSNGHEYAPENTHHDRTGARVCRACSREKSRRYADRKRRQEDAA